MSLLPLRFKSTIRAFQPRKPVKTWLEQGEYIEGVWEKTRGTDKRIKAVVLTMKPEELGFYPQGNTSQGGIALLTSETLYFSDVNNTGLQSKQTYVEYQGYTFRVCGTGFTGANADFNVYHALRFTDYADAN